MKTAGSLSDRSKAELSQLAKTRGVRGWATMDKPALVKALSKGAATPAASAAKTTRPVKKANAKVVSKGATAKPAAPRVTRPEKPVAEKQPPKSVVKVAVPVAKPAPPAARPAVLKPMANGTNGTHKTSAPTPAVKSAARPLPPRTGSGASSGGPVKSLIPRPPARDSSREGPTPRLTGPLTKDRILLAVSNPYWLNAYWELSGHSVQRAEAALKQDWHGARLIIRLFDVTSQDTTSTSETPVKDIQLQGPGQNWYIDVPQPPRMYRADIGYVSRRGEFYVLARSNVVTPPKAGAGEAGDAIETTWDDSDAKWKAERMLAMSSGFESAGSPELREFLEERTGRTLGPPKETAFGTGATPPGSVKKFFFEIDAKLIVFGRTDPAAHLTLNNDPIKLNPDGTFRMTFNLPDSRQIIPAVAASADGVEERTIVLAVERNTKHLDPMIHDQMNEV
jgi:hypothetical protein